MGKKFIELGKDDLYDIIEETLKDSNGSEQISKYDNFTKAMHLYKRLVEYSFENTLNIKEPLEQQERAWNIFEKIIDNLNLYNLDWAQYEVKNLEMWLPYTLNQKEKVLSNIYLKKRTESLLNKNKNLELVYSVLVKAKHKITKEVRQKISPNVMGYQVEQQLEYLVTNPDYLPEFTGFKNISYDDVEIMEAQNLIGFKKKSSELKNPKYIKSDVFDINYFNNYIDQFDYLIMARVKKSKRELEKLSHWILGLKDLSFDSMGTIEVVPNNSFLKEYYNIVNLEGTKNFFPVYKYFPELRKYIENKKRPINELQPELNKELKQFEHETINAAKSVYSKLIDAKAYEQTYKVPYPDFSKIVTPQERNLLLKEFKIYRIYQGERLETIMFTPEYFKYYRGEIGHHTFYERWRAEKMKTERVRANKDYFGEKLEQKLKNLFFVNNDKSS